MLVSVSGVYYYTDGSVLHGEWENGVLHGTIKWEHHVAYVAQGAYEVGLVLLLFFRTTGSSSLQTSQSSES